VGRRTVPAAEITGFWADLMIIMQRRNYLVGFDEF
jgi:hypothetical protein